MARNPRRRGLSRDGQRWKRKKKKTKQTVGNDMWDREDLSNMTRRVPPFPTAREKLGDFVATGEPALNDAFWALLKAEPETVDPATVDPEHLKNLVVMQEMLELDETKRLRRYSVNDDVQSALSSVALEPDLEVLFDKVDETMKDAADAYQQAAEDLADAQQAAGDAQADIDEIMAQAKARAEAQGDGDGDGQPELSDEEQEKLDEANQKLQDAADEIREKQQELNEAADELEKQMDKAGTQASTALSQAMDNAADEASDLQAAARAWGLDPGQFQRLPAEERMQLAKKFLADTRMREIAKLFGNVFNTALSEQKKKTNNVPEEVVDVTLGNELARLLPKEFLALEDEDLELDFLRRFTDKQLLQYEMSGVETLNQGGIIFCEDNSGSMKGQREIWAKAVCLSLLHLARKQKRTMHVVHFGGPGAFKTFSFTKPEDFTPDRIMDVAEFFLGGGTDFQTPMQESLRILQDEFADFGGTRADVVFCTDDECGVQADFMEQWHEAKDELEFSCWGISVAGASRYGGYGNTLKDMTDGKVATIEDFLSGKDIKSIFRGV